MAAIARPWALGLSAALHLGLIVPVLLLLPAAEPTASRAGAGLAGVAVVMAPAAMVSRQVAATSAVSAPAVTRPTQAEAGKPVAVAATAAPRIPLADAPDAASSLAPVARAMAADADSQVRALPSAVTAVAPPEVRVDARDAPRRVTPAEPVESKTTKSQPKRAAPPTHTREEGEPHPVQTAALQPRRVRAETPAATPVPVARPVEPPSATETAPPPSPTDERADEIDDVVASAGLAGQPADAPLSAGGPSLAGEESLAGSGRSTASAGYLARLRAWLEQHKRYPRRARLAREEGTVTLVFVIDRTGSVLESHVARSSGHEALDAEAAAMLARAEPLPLLPAEVPDERLTVTLPVEFLMR